MNLLRVAPFLRLLLPFVAGILTGINNHSFPLSPYSFTWILAGLIGLYFIFNKSFSQIRFHYIFASGSYLLLFFSGNAVCLLHTESLDKNHFSHHRVTDQFVVVHLISGRIEKEKSFKATGEVEMIRYGKDWKRLNGKLLIYFKKNPEAEKIKYGDRILMKCTFQNILPPPNPGMFDYRSYLSNRNILRQTYVNVSQWKLISTDCGNALVLACVGVRDRLLALFKQYPFSEKEFAVGSALLLGFEERMDPELLGAYSAAGVLHVLSVSGLHVAIVYVVFNGLLFFFERFRHGSFLKAIILLIFLWMYAAITGLSPSVLRSVAMISFIIIGKAYRKNANVFNMLAVSAFLLLCFNSYLIMDVGFQLSYLAVLGIVGIQPLIYEKWKAPNWITEQAWTLVSVSIAAQAITFPLALFYFHQFPNYFLLSNLIVIPLSTCAIYAGILFFVAHAIPHAGYSSAWIFDHLLKLLNGSVEFSARLPYAVMKGISISMAETVLLYLILILFFYFLASKRILYFYFFLISTILFVSVQCRESFLQSGQRYLVVYSVSRASAVDIIQGRSCYFFQDSIFQKKSSDKNFFIQPNRQILNIENEKNHLLSMLNCKVRIFKGRSILFLKSQQQLSDGIKADYVIISKGADPRIFSGEENFSFGHVIIDSSCGRNEIAKWKKIFSKHGINPWVIAENGAFIVRFS